MKKFFFQNSKLIFITLKRWTNSNEQRIIEWQSIPFYWKLKSKKENFFFFLKKILFRTKWQFEEKKEWNSARFVIFKVFLKPFLFALLLLTLLETISYLLHSKTFLRPFLPQTLADFWDWKNENVKIDIATYRTLLGPLVTVSGAFLGLYFTALNVLLNTTYKQVTSDVRTLLIRDKVGDIYTRTVAFTGVYSLLLFGFATLGFSPSIFSLFLIVCLGITEFYCFLYQWFSLFRLFDPATLVYYLSKDLVLLIKEATVDGRWSQDVSFQHHFQSKAEETLNTYQSLILTVKSEEHLRSRSLIKLANSLISFLGFYENVKHKISTESKWFRTTFQHKEWITASHSETSIATQTGTTLQPKEVSDLLWFEKEVGKIIDFSIAGFIEKEDLRNAIGVFNSFQNLAKSTSRNYCVEEAFLLFQTIKLHTKNHIQNFDVPPMKSESEMESLRFTLAIVDFYGLSFINILLGFSEGIEKITLDHFKNLIEKQQNDSKSIYKAKLPQKVLQEFERSEKHLDFERKIEERIVTPIWYQQQLVVLSYFRFMESTINLLLSDLEEVFLNEAESLIKAKKFLIAIQLIERGFEACNKFEHHFYFLEEHCKEINKAQILSDIPWVNFSWEDYQNKIQSIHEKLVVLFSKSLYPIMQLPKNKDLPDYFGHAYTVLTNECFLAMANNNDELFKNLFPSVFVACLEAHDRQKGLEIAHLESKFALVADPIVDLFELSGYSIIFQELDGKNFWDIAKKTWDSYFSDKDDVDSTTKALVILGTHFSYMMSPRSITRTSWGQHLHRIFRERGLMNDDMFGSYYLNQEEPEKHKSQIINYLSRSIMIHDDAGEIFVAIYFKNQIENKSIEVSDKIKELFNEFQKEKYS